MHQIAGRQKDCFSDRGGMQRTNSLKYQGSRGRGPDAETLGERRRGLAYEAEDSEPEISGDSDSQVGHPGSRGLVKNSDGHATLLQEIQESDWKARHEKPHAIWPFVWLFSPHALCRDPGDVKCSARQDL